MHTKMRVHPQIIFVFILLLLGLQGRSSSHARPVNKVFATVLTNDQELALEGDSSFSLQKEILPNAANIGGRRMSVEKREKASKVPMALSEGSGRRKGDEEAKNWKDNSMAFSADYRPPKPHPPKNN